MQLPETHRALRVTEKALLPGTQRALRGPGTVLPHKVLVIREPSLDAAARNSEVSRGP